MVEVTVELTKSLDHIRLIVGDVVVDPHPPGRVKAGNGVGEVDEELSVPGGRAVTGTTIVVVPGAGCSPGSVVGVAQDVLAATKGSGEVITTGGSDVTAVSNSEQ